MLSIGSKFTTEPKLHLSLRLLCLAGVAALGCGGGSSAPQGGVVGFVTGTETPGAVPSDGTSPDAPIITALTATNTSIGKGQALRINITFSDLQGDASMINFGIAGEVKHATLAASTLAGQTGGTLTLDLYPANYVPGTYALLVSITDKAGHLSAPATLAFTIISGIASGVDAGAIIGTGGAIDAGKVTGTGGSGGARLDGGSADGFTITPVLDAAPTSQETILFKMESVQNVSFNPPVATIFTLPAASHITRVWTYHYGATIGSKSPTVAFKDTTTGVVYGPWSQVGYKTFAGTLGATKSDPGNMAGPPDNYWMAYPAQTVPAGTYQVIDSDPATWAYTSDLGNRGSTWVYGWSLGGAVDAGAQGPDVTRAVDAGGTSADIAVTADATIVADATPTPAWSAPVLVESTTGTVSTPKLAMDSSGNIIAVWVQGDGTANNIQNIYANRYTVGGGWGTPALLETSDMPADSPIIAMDSSGNALVVWHQAWKTVNGANYGLYANRFTAGVGWGTSTTVYADTSTDGVTANAPDKLAFDGNGNAMVVWTLYEWSWNHTSVRTTRYVAGTGWAASDVMDTGTTSAFSPNVALDSAGNAIVLWVQSSNGADTVFANRYVPGTGWGKSAALEATPRGNAKSPAVAFAPDGSAMAIWYNYGLRGITFNRYITGKGWGDAVLVSETGDTGYDEGVRFTFDKDGNALAVWNRYGGALYGSRYAAAVSWSTPVAIEPSGNDYSGQVAVYANGNGLAVWGRYASNSYNIWSSQYVVATGWGTPIMVNVTPDNTSEPNLVLDKNGRATVVWIQSGSLYSASAAF